MHPPWTGIGTTGHAAPVALCVGATYPTCGFAVSSSSERGWLHQGQVEAQPPRITAPHSSQDHLVLSRVVKVRDKQVPLAPEGGPCENDCSLCDFIPLSCPGWRRAGDGGPPALESRNPPSPTRPWGLVRAGQMPGRLLESASFHLSRQQPVGTWMGSSSR